MTTVEKTGRTVNEAVAEALKDLGVERDKVEIEVLEEGSKGLFGLLGSKVARVRVSLKNRPEDKAEKAAEYLQKMINLMGVSGQVAWNIDGDTINLDVEGESLGILIGRRGQTLDAIQYLVSLAVNEPGNWNRIIIDAEGYRQKREETLRQLAERLADKAKSTGRRVVLDPMNAAERRIIHMTLQGDTEVETYSEGQEPHRKIIISPVR